MPTEKESGNRHYGKYVSQNGPFGITEGGVGHSVIYAEPLSAWHKGKHESFVRQSDVHFVKPVFNLQKKCGS